ncbi:unnamed protein product [Prorocentrum cordatum]|uniref:Uncharacterized protein n=1 Tax=Prorocentrum cordatum TaxID=2364126 RepID=A0ABN9WI14_9DINO|nr:unnamed protein product [Polarella glacialis]
MWFIWVESAQDRFVQMLKTANRVHGSHAAGTMDSVDIAPAFVGSNPCMGGAGSGFDELDLVQLASADRPSPTAGWEPDSFFETYVRDLMDFNFLVDCSLGARFGDGLPLNEATQIIEAKLALEQLLSQRLLDCRIGWEWVAWDAETGHCLAGYSYAFQRVERDTLRQFSSTPPSWHEMKISPCWATSIRGACIAAQGRARTDRPDLSSVLFGPLGTDRKADEWVDQAVMEDDLTIRPTRRAALELFGFLGPAMLARPCNALLRQAEFVGFATWLRSSKGASPRMGERALSAAGDREDYTCTQSWTRSDNFRAACRRWSGQTNGELLAHLGRNVALESSGAEARQVLSEMAAELSDLVGRALAQPRCRGPALSRPLLERCAGNDDARRRRVPRSISSSKQRRPDKVPVLLDFARHLVAEHLARSELAFRGTRDGFDFGPDPLEPLLGAARSSCVPETAELLDVGRIMCRAGRAASSSACRLVLLALADPGIKGILARQEAANALTDTRCFAIMTAGCAFDELPHPGLPDEVAAMLQEAARVAAFAVALDKLAYTCDRMDYRRFAWLVNEYMLRAFRAFWTSGARALQRALGERRIVGSAAAVGAPAAAASGPQAAELAALSELDALCEALLQRLLPALRQVVEAAAEQAAGRALEAFRHAPGGAGAGAPGATALGALQPGQAVTVDWTFTNASADAWAAGAHLRFLGGQLAPPPGYRPAGAQAPTPAGGRLSVQAPMAKKPGPSDGQWQLESAAGAPLSPPLVVAATTLAPAVGSRAVPAAAGHGASVGGAVPAAPSFGGASPRMAARVIDGSAAAGLLAGSAAPSASTRAPPAVDVRLPGLGAVSSGPGLRQPQPQALQPQPQPAALRQPSGPLPGAPLQPGPPLGVSVSLGTAPAAAQPTGAGSWMPSNWIQIFEEFFGRDVAVRLRMLGEKERERMERLVRDHARAQGRCQADGTVLLDEVLSRLYAPVIAPGVRSCSPADLAEGRGGRRREHGISMNCRRSARSSRGACSSRDCGYSGRGDQGRSPPSL